jgi:hypothetical protein
MSDQSAQLLPLSCLKCSTPVTAGPNEVAWACATCGQGHLLDEVKGLLPIDVFFSKAIPPGKNGRPFWVARGQVAISQRETYRGDEGRSARAFWAEPRLFYAPAWECAIDEVLGMGSHLLRNPERMEPGSPAPFLPVVTPPSDLQSLAEFIIVSLEAERRDALKTINFNLTLEPAQLWVLA